MNIYDDDNPVKNHNLMAWVRLRREQERARAKILKRLMEDCRAPVWNEQDELWSAVQKNPGQFDGPARCLNCGHAFKATGEQVRGSAEDNGRVSVRYECPHCHEWDARLEADLVDEYDDDRDDETP